MQSVSQNMYNHPDFFPSPNVGDDPAFAFQGLFAPPGGDFPPSFGFFSDSEEMFGEFSSVSSSLAAPQEKPPMPSSPPQVSVSPVNQDTPVASVKESAPFPSSGKSKKKRTAKEEEYSEIDQSRVWSPESPSSAASDTEIFMKTRLSPLLQVVPCNLYCTLKYRLMVEASSLMMADTPEVAFIASLRLEDSSGAVVPGAFKKSDLEVAFRHLQDKHIAELSFALHPSSSWQKTHSQYRLRISIFRASERRHAVAEYSSPLFRIYARKPNYSKKKKQSSQKGRSNKGGLSKSQKVRHSSISTARGTLASSPALVKSFNQQLDELFSLQSSFDEAEVKKSHELVFHKLFELLSSGA